MRASASFLQGALPHVAATLILASFFQETSMQIGFHVFSLLHNYTALKRSHTRDVLMLIDCAYF